LLLPKDHYIACFDVTQACKQAAKPTATGSLLLERLATHSVRLMSLSKWQGPECENKEEVP